FGPTAFDDAALPTSPNRRWLEITIPPAPTLSPRQELTATPYAIAVRGPLRLKGDYPGNRAIQGYNLSSNNDSTGLFGYATNTSGTTYGVWGQSDSSEGYGGYFIGRGYFSGNVGVGNLSPQYQLDVAGVVRSSGGGFRFPDDTVQTTAAISGPPAWSLSGN